MKKIIIIIFLIFILVSTLYAENNMEFSIKNKIFNYLNTAYNISNNNILYDIIDKEKIPNFQLYEIKIINKNKIEPNERINFQIKISSFFNKNNHHIVTVEVFIMNFIDITKKKIKLNKNDRIKIIYKNKNIKFTDMGTINKIVDSDIIIVKNSFNYLLKCRLI